MFHRNGSLIADHTVVVDSTYVWSLAKALYHFIQDNHTFVFNGENTTVVNVSVNGSKWYIRWQLHTILHPQTSSKERLNAVVVFIPKPAYWGLLFSSPLVCPSLRLSVTHWFSGFFSAAFGILTWNLVYELC